MSDLQDDMVLEIDPGLVFLVLTWHGTHGLFHWADAGRECGVSWSIELYTISLCNATGQDHPTGSFATFPVRLGAQTKVSLSRVMISNHLKQCECGNF